MIIKKIIKKFIPKSRFEKTVAKFKEENKKHNLMLNYDLNENSLVFDVGGYKGQGASDIFSMYLPTIYIFEPRAEYAQAMEKRFKKNNKIKIFNFGLSNKKSDNYIYFNDDGSTLFLKNSQKEKVKLESISDFIKNNNIKKIDLLKLNMEGGEYEVLDDLINFGLLNIITNLQIQFHNFFPDAKKKMMDIHKELRKTHNLVYQYEFVMENWQLKKSYDNN